MPKKKSRFGYKLDWSKMDENRDDALLYIDEIEFHLSFNEIVKLMNLLTTIYEEMGG